LYCVDGYYACVTITLISNLLGYF